ncbi:MAG: AmmeMemoRadiSam system protein A [Chloroflexi bacterium]|nr:AmmeMemoRadiSam system protein A [Chloroflexota bacterium]
MAGLVYGTITPHPPLLIPEVGGPQLRRIDATVKGMQVAAARLAAANPQSIIVISPHSPGYMEAMGIATGPRLAGDFANFRAPNVRLAFPVDKELVTAIQEQARQRGIPLRPTTQLFGGYGLDWGVLVPMYYLHQQLPDDLPIVSLSFSRLPYADHFAFGQAIRAAVEGTGKRVAFVASGDLSHRLLPEAPAGYDPIARTFDQSLVEAVRNKDIQAIMHFDPDLIERAGECGLRSIIVLLGALDGVDATPEVLSYEGPFGVGYMVASFSVPVEAATGTSAGSPKATPARHPLVELAKQAVEAYVRQGRIIQPPQESTPEMQAQAGVFVCLKKQGELRGCIGTFEPTQPNVAGETIRNAICSATQDYRFPEPVREHELAALEYTVDVLTPPESVASEAELDPKRYGVIVESAGRRGLLLPDLEGVDTAQQQIAITRRKAGIGPHEPVKLYRFEVRRFT